jgi:hypothetical protein
VDQVYVREEGAREEVVSRYEIVFSDTYLYTSILAPALARLVGVSNKRGGEQKQGTRQFLYHTHI